MLPLAATKTTGQRPLTQVSPAQPRAAGVDVAEMGRRIPPPMSIVTPPHTSPPPRPNASRKGAQARIPARAEASNAAGAMTAHRITELTEQLESLRSSYYDERRMRKKTDSINVEYERRIVTLEAEVQNAKQFIHALGEATRQLHKESSDRFWTIIFAALSAFFIGVSALVGYLNRRDEKRKKALAAYQLVPEASERK